MRVLLDGFNLGQRQGTGLATYTRELARVLEAHGHEVSCLYAITGVSRKDEVQWASLLQRMHTHGGLSSRDWRHLWWRLLWHGLPTLAGLPLTVKPIEKDDRIHNPDMNADIDLFEHIYNVPALYRVSQALTRVMRLPRYISLPAGRRVDLFHLTSPLPLAMRGAKTVVTIHDLIPITLPFSTKVNLGHYWNLIKTSLAHVDAITTVSESSRRDLHHLMGIPLDKIFVTYQAVTVPSEVQAMSERQLADWLERTHGLKAGKYFLYYGAIEPKKNVGRILEAALASGAGLPLVVAGKDGWLCDEITTRLGAMAQSPRLRNRVIRVDYLPQKDLMLLVRGARALIFPSLAEGFGLPVLEAMSLGTPVLTSRAGALSEVGGEAALYVEATDTRALAEAMDQLALDDALCASLAQKGRLQAQQFSADKHYQRLKNVYEAVLSS